MKFRAMLFAAVLGFVSLTACAPIDRLWQTINNTLAWVVGTAPNGSGINCAVVIFDQQVNSQLQTFFKPADVNVALWPAWTSACLTGPSHSLPTFKASGYPNDVNLQKRAICWAHPGYVPGDPGFRCSFDYQPRFFWVGSLATSKDGQMAVGATTT